MSEVTSRRGRRRANYRSVPRRVAAVERLEARQLLSTSTPAAVRINAGGPAYTDSTGAAWSADEDYSGGSVTSTPYAVAGTPDPALIYSRRWGNFSYTLPLADGSYTLALFFAEPRDTGPDQRLFDVTAQGQSILSNFDIYAAAGYQTEVTKTFPVTVAAGSLSLNFTTVKDTACVSAIEVVPLGAVTPPGPLPSPWSDTDIGSVGKPGSATWQDGADPVITVSGGGTDIWNDVDAFNFAYQPLVGDGSIVAQVVSEADTDAWAKAGVMIRETLHDDSRNVMLALTPDHGVTFQSRSATHNVTTNATTAAAVGDWIELVRTGSTFTAELSTDGVHWTVVGSATIPMVNNVYVGLCVTAHNNNDANLSAFDHVAITTTGAAASDWSDGPTTPDPRWESESVTYDGKLYTFGGFVTESLGETAECDVFDPVSETWQFLTDLPTGPLAHAGITLVGDTVYLAGGDRGAFTYGKTLTATAAVLTYNLDTNTWGSIPSLPTAVSCGGLVAIDNVLYYFGGINPTDKADVSNTYAFDLNDPSTGWVGKAPMPDARNHIGYAAIDGVAYAVGGQHLYTEHAGNVAEVDAYDPVTNTWKQVASLPQPRGSIEVSTVVINGKIVVVGGQTDGGYDGIYLNSVESYDPMTDQWADIATLPEANEGLTPAYLDGQLFVADGTVDDRGGWVQDQTWVDPQIDF